MRIFVALLVCCSWSWLSHGQAPLQSMAQNSLQPMGLQPMLNTISTTTPTLTTMAAPVTPISSTLTAMRPNQPSAPTKLASMQPPAAVASASLLAMRPATKTPSANLLAMQKPAPAQAGTLLAMQPPARPARTQLARMEQAPTTANTTLLAMQRNLPQGQARKGIADPVTALAGIPMAPLRTPIPVQGPVVAQAFAAGPGPAAPSSAAMLRVALEDAINRQAELNQTPIAGRNPTRVTDALLEIMRNARTLPAVANPLAQLEDLSQQGYTVPITLRPERDLLLLGVELNGIPQTNLIQAYQNTSNTLWLPLGAMANLLQIPLTINPTAGLVTGWYRQPSQTVVLNIATGQAIINGQRQSLNGQLERHANDLYIASDALAKWFRVTPEFNYSQLQLTLKTAEPLPSRLAELRQQSWEVLARSQLTQAPPTDTLVMGYNAFSAPTLRLNSNFNTQSAGGKSTNETTFSVQAEQDLLYATSNLNLAFSRRNNQGTQFNNGSWLVQRTDETGMLGQLGATYVGLGDIITNPIPLSNLAANGRGVTINNLPAGAIENPDQFQISGMAPSNWDVEVYQNDTLVKFARIDTTGRYSFNALPLRNGRNVFTVKLFGPLGQREERTAEYFLGANLPKQGEWRYVASVYQPGQGLFSELSSRVPQSTSLSTVASSQFSVGLTPNLMLKVGAYGGGGQPPESANGGNLATTAGLAAGLQANIANSFLTFDYLASNEGQSLAASARRNLFNRYGVRLSHSQNLNYRRNNRNELTNTELELELPTTKLGQVAVGQNIGLRNTTYQQQLSQQALNYRLGAMLYGVNLNNTLSYLKQGQQTNLLGTLEASGYNLGNTALRTALTYRPDQAEMLQNALLNAQVPVGYGRNLNLTYSQNLVDNGASNLSANLQWNTGPFMIGVQGQTGSRGDVQMGLSLGTALVPQSTPVASADNALAPAAGNPDAAKISYKLMSPNQSAGTGQVSVRVFIDENNNQQFDATETTVPNITLVSRRGARQVTNQNGISTLTGLIPGVLNQLEVDPYSLPNVYLQPVSPTLNLVVRPGPNGVVNLALRAQGEIDGTLTNAVNQVLANQPVWLLNAQGQTIAQTLTAFDGYFNFPSLALGRYQVSAGHAAQPVTLTAQQLIQNVALISTATTVLSPTAASRPTQP